MRRKTIISAFIAISCALYMNPLKLTAAEAVKHKMEIKIMSINGKCNWNILIAGPDKQVPKQFDINKAKTWQDYNNPGYEQAAALELASILKKITGAKPDILILKDKSEAAKYPNSIVIGKLAVELGARVPKSTFGIDGSVVTITKNRILLAGETPLASYFAMTRLAELAGCRWYMPGKLGEIIPKKKEIMLPAGKYPEVPAIWSRYLWTGGGRMGASKEVRTEFHRWLLHNRQYGVHVNANHIWAKIMPHKKYFKEHPEWYTLVKGKRQARMLCTSNEEMTREFIKNYKKYMTKDLKLKPNAVWFSLSQDDGANFCECSNCTALDIGLKDPTAPNLPQITDRLVNFYNKIVTELVKDYPDKYFCFLAYVNSTMPPLREKLHPHLMPMIAPISYSRYHAMNAKNSETMQALQHYIKEWSKVSKYIAYYGYAYNLADVILPYTRESQTRHDIPFMFKNNLGAVCMETALVWENLLPYYYLLAKMNLNPELDADKLINEFYKDFFGPAANDMKAYMDMLKDAYANFDYEIGNQWFAHLLFTPEIMKKGDQYLSAAENKAEGNEILKDRIVMWRFAFKSAQLFLRMRIETNKFEFQKASDTAGKFYALGEKMLKKNPRTVFWYAYKKWWRIFWKRHLEFCAKKLKGAEVLYKFPDEWYAIVDYSGIGKIGQLYNPDFPLSKWMKLKTYSKTIEEQNLIRFRGTIWYRNSFKVDKKNIGKKLHLLFAGVDNEIYIYLNGKYAGTQKGGSFDAFDFDVSTFVKAGDNTLVCAINNEGITELGTGGIMRPVLLYIPEINKTK